MIQPPWPPPALEPLVSEHVEEGAYPFRWKHHKRWGQVVWPGVGTDDESVVQAMQAAEAATVAFNSGRKCALGSPELARHFSTAWKLIKTAEIGDPYNAPILKVAPGIAAVLELCAVIKLNQVPPHCVDPDKLLNTIGRFSRAADLLFTTSTPYWAKLRKIVIGALAEVEIAYIEASLSWPGGAPAKTCRETALAYKTAVAIGKTYNLEARESDRMLAAGYGHEITESISYNLEATIPAKAARAPKAMTEIVELTTI